MASDRRRARTPTKADDSDFELDDDYETSEENEEVSGEDSLELEGAAAELHGTEADVDA